MAGLAVASLPDLLATKLKVLGDRPELRDYFDDLVHDPGLPTGRDAIVAYWQHRQPEIVASLARR